MKRVYLDYAASTPVDPIVGKAMSPYFGKIFGNPSSLHAFGQEASRAISAGRKTVAEAIGADYKEIIFTGSATESNNLALRGIARTVRGITQNNFRVGPRLVRDFPRPRIIVSAVEHESVLETCRDLEKDGVEVIYLPVSREGMVDLKKLKAALNDRTVLVSVMYANNETGTIQPIAEISKIIKAFSVERLASGKSSKTLNANRYYPLLHTDAAQAFQYLDCDADKLGVDLMTLSAHKIYGPKGTGALYIRQAFSVERLASGKSAKTLNAGRLNPIVTGGNQEFGFRSGTENVAAIVGFAKAAEITNQIRKEESERVGKLRNYFYVKLKKALKNNIALNGSLKNSLPNILNIYFPGQKAQELLIKLDLAGVSVSAGAACSSRISQKSYVLEALGFSPDRCSGSLRFSLGRQTSKADIDRVINILYNAASSRK